MHKNSVFVCILNENGVVCHEKFGVLTTDLEKMLGLLKQYDVGEVCMESTSVRFESIATDTRPESGS